MSVVAAVAAAVVIAAAFALLVVVAVPLWWVLAVLLVAIAFGGLPNFRTSLILVIFGRAGDRVGVRLEFLPPLRTVLLETCPVKWWRFSAHWGGGDGRLPVCQVGPSL